ncbi:hypothetical protein NESM_000729200 [Novymonas esmeraldas]|uniref:Uncharacterized protein n=1 Tax=Novymonas esmeraldas TaxID=1808958 RepID=A0AAW0EW66_9TRYP
MRAAAASSSTAPAAAAAAASSSFAYSTPEMLSAVTTANDNIAEISDARTRARPTSATSANRDHSICREADIELEWKTAPAAQTREPPPPALTHSRAGGAASGDDASVCSATDAAAAVAAVPTSTAAPPLTAVEEQPPRGSASGIPAIVVLRHRMGYSTVVLSAHQRATYGRHDLENFVLYKERKYDSVNVLWRFCVLVLVVLSFAVFCLVFSTCTTEWLSVQNGDTYVSVGLFVACSDRLLRTCTSRQSSQLEWVVVDAVTGATLCHASADFARRFIGALWAMGILQLICEAAALVLCLRILSRPTRSGALVALFFDLLLSMCCGITTVVLFTFYTACLRRTCEGQHVSSKVCNVHYRYGYRLYIGAVAVHGLLLVLALCMHSFIHNIRVTARQQLRHERRRLAREVQEDDYVVRMLSSPPTTDLPSSAGAAAAAASGGVGGSEHVWSGSGTRPAWTTARAAPAPATRRHAAMASTTTATTTVSPVSAGATHPSTSWGNRSGGVGEREASDAAVDAGERAGRHVATLRPALLAAAESSVGRAERDAEDGALAGVAAPRARDGVPLHQDRPHISFAGVPDVADAGAELLSGSRRGPASRPTRARRRARLGHRTLRRFFDREYDANYLTAAELGVPIAGATDWVYDDRSDMYYSFDRHMFWDPLTHEYYSCALKSWQESPSHVVEVRDVLDYMLESPPPSSGSSSSGSGSGNDGSGASGDESDMTCSSGDREDNALWRQRRRQRCSGEPITPATASGMTTTRVGPGGGGGDSALSVFSSRVNRPMSSGVMGEGEAEMEEVAFTSGSPEGTTLLANESVAHRPQ